MRLLLVEDDAELAAGVRADLVKAGFAVDTCDNGIDAEHLGDTEPYDVVVLDLGLPAKPGIDVLYERVDGFREGADDYLGKPFHIEELIARIRALIHRRHGQAVNSIDAGGLHLDEDLQQIRLADGSMRELTGTEFRLLRYMMLNAGRILSKSMLSDHVYDQDSDRDSNLIEVYVRRLREKIGASMILTKRGQGYIFNDGSRQP